MREGEKKTRQAKKNKIPTFSNFEIANLVKQELWRQNMISQPTSLLFLYSTVLPVLVDVYTSRLTRTIVEKSLSYHHGSYSTGYSYAMEHLGLSTLAIHREQLCLKFAGSLMVSEFRDWLPGRTQGSITDRVTHKPVWKPYSTYIVPTVTTPICLWNNFEKRSD